MLLSQAIFPDYVISCGYDRTQQTFFILLWYFLQYLFIIFHSWDTWIWLHQFFYRYFGASLWCGIVWDQNLTTYWFWVSIFLLHQEHTEQFNTQCSYLCRNKVKLLHHIWWHTAQIRFGDLGRLAGATSTCLVLWLKRKFLKLNYPPKFITKNSCSWE